MITCIEALNYRCLRYIRQPLESFQVLVGPNASGKTTFLDVVGFLSDFVSEGLNYAISKRSPRFQDLLFAGQGDAFELALEFQVPEKLKRGTPLEEEGAVCRYELRVVIDSESEEVVVDSEAVRFYCPPPGLIKVKKRDFFPSPKLVTESIMLGNRGRGNRRVLSKSRNGGTNYYVETSETVGKDWAVSWQLGPQKSALANLPEDEQKFPISTWIKQLLIKGVQVLTLDGQTLRKASPPNQPKRFKPDASNLPFVVEEFRSKHPKRFDDWVEHLKEALPTLIGVETIEQPWDKYRYLVLIYEDGLRIPSWTASDGTLRMLALTLPAFLPDLEGVFLIEEPENGIHPKAVATLQQALSSVYQAQVLVATHSPVFLGLVEPHQILCFAKDSEGATDIVRGDQHPMLADWQHEVNLQDYFISGVLG